MQDFRSDVSHKRHHADDDADDVHDVVSIAEHLTGSATIGAPLLVELNGTRERLRDEWSLQVGRVELFSRRMAGGNRKIVDQLEDEKFGKGAAQVRDAARELAC